MAATRSSPEIEVCLHRARRRSQAFRVLECLACAALACALTLAGAELSSAGSIAATELTAAALSSAAAAGTWWLESRRRAGALVRFLDRELGQGGALVTARELEARGGSSEIARLLTRRVGAALASADLRRALRPPSPGWLAALALAVGLWAAAYEIGAPSADERRSRTITLALQSLAAAGVESGLTQGQRAALAQAAATWREQGDREPSAADFEALWEGLDGLRELESRVRDPRIAVQIETLRRSLDGRSMPSDSRARGSDANSALAGAQAERTMSDSQGAPRVQSGPPQTNMPRASDPLVSTIELPGAALGGRWWDRRHDPVVAGWIESRRRSELAPTQGPEVK